MKYIKYTALTIIFFLLITSMIEIKAYNSDSLIQNGSSFTYYNFNMKYHDKNKNDKFLYKFSKKAEEKDLGIYVVYKTVKDHNKTGYIIFCNKKAENNLKERLGIYTSPINIKSLFVGDREIVFKDFSQLSPQKCYDVQFFGDIKNARAVRTELIGEYDSSAVYPGESLKDIYFTENAILFIILAFAFLMSVYQFMFKKKEYAVQIILGESRMRLVLNNILADGLIMGLLMGTIMIIYRCCWGQQVNIRYYLIVIALFVLISSIPEFFILGVNIHRSISTGASSNGFRILNYTMKCIILIVTVAILSTNLFFIVQSINVVGQKNEWSKMSGYKNYDMPVDNVSVAMLKKQFPDLKSNFDYSKNKYALLNILQSEIEYDFFKQNRKNAFIFEAEKTKRIPTYTLNKNAFVLVARNYPDLIKQIKNKKVAVLYPADIKKPDVKNVKGIREENVIKYYGNIKLFNYDRGNGRMIYEDKYLIKPIIYIIDDNAARFMDYAIKKTSQNGSTISYDIKYHSIDSILLSGGFSSINYDMNGREKEYDGFFSKWGQYIDRVNILENDVYGVYKADEKIYTNILYVNSVVLVLLLLLDLFLL